MLHFELRRVPEPIDANLGKNEFEVTGFHPQSMVRMRKQISAPASTGDTTKE